MTRRRIILLAISVLLLGVIVSCLVPYSEPVYKGKKLSEWMYITVDAYALSSDVDPPLKYGEARSAINAIGTNGLPTIRRMLRAHDGAIRRRLVKFVNSHDIFRSHLHTDEEKTHAAVLAIAILGKDSQPLLPDVVRLAQNPEAKFRAWGMSSLVRIMGRDFNGILPFKSAVLSLLRDRVNDSDQEVSSRAWMAVQFLEAPDRRAIMNAYRATLPHQEPPATNPLAPPQ